MIKVHRQQQFQVPQGTKVYLVNPESLRHNVHQNFDGGTAIKPHTINLETQSATRSVSAPKVIQERKYRKRKIDCIDLSYEDDEDVVYSKIFGRETTTRTGRVSKASKHLTLASVKPIKSSETSTMTEQTNGVKVKKREPASVFRCPTCQKVYIGFSKLNLHFRKFPGHYNYNKKGASDSDPEKFVSPKKNNSSETFHSSKFLHCETQTDGCLISIQAQVLAKAVSPPPLLNSTKSDNYSFVPSLLLPNDESDNGVCLQTTGAEPHHRSLHHRSTSSSSSNSDFCTQNFGGYRNTNHHHQNDNSRSPVNDGMMGNGFDNSSRQCTSADQSTRQNNSPSPSSTSPFTATTKHNNNHNHSGVSHNEIPHHFVSSIQKRAWDLIEEKMTHQGINEILLELTDVADKLAKIARDKIIPIREEEEEHLRLNSNVPIVQVDSPFLSHLLDLPFGTYMFKEDLGIRKLLPPPVSADLSLTGGEEVDVGKFLTPDIDLISLPHLTNIDFAAICSNN